MSEISDLTPINLGEEKSKFFAKDCQYNPQFKYRKKFSKKELEKYGKPKLWYLFLAKRIIKKHQSSNKNRVNETNEVFLDKKEIEKIIEEKMGSYNLGKHYEIIFSENFISRISVNSNSKEKQIKVRLPIKISREEIESILNHEIDTHVLRRINYEKQSWFKKKKKLGFENYLRTEEGLAIVNELIAKKDKLAFKSAVNYFAVRIALKKDFIAVFNFLNSIFNDKERAWTLALKKKRGISDTSKAGGYTKDLVYFEGFIKILKYLKKNQYDVGDLYLGKISYKDVEKAKKISTKDELLFPKAYTQNLKEYKKAIGKIVKENLF